MNAQEFSAFALSIGLNDDYFRSLVPDTLWTSDPESAEILALRRSGIFDESAYLDAYPDVKQSGGDPLEHFVHFGIAEKRKFFLVKPAKKPSPSLKKEDQQAEKATPFKNDLSTKTTPHVAASSNRSVSASNAEEIRNLQEENKLLFDQLTIVQEKLEESQRKLRECQAAAKNLAEQKSPAPVKPVAPAKPATPAPTPVVKPAAKPATPAKPVEKANTK